MTTAADVVRLQGDMLTCFREPDPRVRGATIEVTTGSGAVFAVPISRLGRAVDHAMFGDDTRHPAVLAATLQPGRHSSDLGSSQTVAPLVAEGVSRGRAFRIQENMTDAIVRRADGYSINSTFFDVREADEGDGIMPPTGAGWAFFEQPVPVLVEAFERDDPTISLITWNTVVQPDGKDWSVPLLWLVVIWEDMTRQRFTSAAEFGRFAARMVPGQRFAPMNAYLITPGEALTGTPITPTESRTAEYADLRVRNMLHVVAALWQMCGETVPGADVDRTVEPTDRRTQRRARIDGMTGDPSEVTTVVLRREYRPVHNPGSGRPQDSRLWIEERMAWRWIGSEARGDRRRVRRPVRAHWSNNDLDLPVRERKIVSELRR